MKLLLPIIMVGQNILLTELHPIKQGLKPTAVSVKYVGGTLLTELHPIKQGLKLNGDLTLDDAVNYCLQYGLTELHPIKQGLKLQ